MIEMYAVKVDVKIDGHHTSRYVGKHTRLGDPDTYVSSYSARLWKRKGGAEGFVGRHREGLPVGARVVSVAV